MTFAEEKPGVLERLGSAMNSGDLSPHLDKGSAVDLLAAMAYAQTNASAEVHDRLDIAVIDPRTELASQLVRLKYAGDRSVETKVLWLLVRWVRHQRAFRKWKLRAGGDSLVERFVRQGLSEWLHPTCDVCHGRQMLGLDRGEIIERRVRCGRCKGRGWLQETPAKSKLGRPQPVVRDCQRCGGSGARTHQKVRKSKPEQCLRCGGTGQKRVSSAERASALGLDVKTGERYWEKRFSWLGAGLDRIDHLARCCLQSQLRSAHNPAASGGSISRRAPGSVSRGSPTQGPGGT